MMKREDAIREINKVFIPRVAKDIIESLSNYSEIPTGSMDDLGVDLISREQAKAAIRDKFKDLPSRVEINTILNELPSVTPQVPQSFEWCDTCKEYDQENHCCHRWTKVIRNTVEEMKQGYEREVLDKLDEIITDALDKSTDQKESQTLRWVLDKISEVVKE